LKIEKSFSLFKLARTTQKKFKFYFILFIYLFIFKFFSRPRGRARVRADASCFIPGNFKKDAIVRRSHGRPRGHRPIVRPSENVRLTTVVKPDVLRAFRECGGVAPTPPEPAELQHLQGSAENEEPICQGSQSSTMHASCGASQNLAAACGPIRNSSGTASQLQPFAGLSSARSLQQSTILVLHAEDQRRKCDMA
jgi:hypothetical protein